MTTHLKDSGAWSGNAVQSVKAAGVWKPATAGFVKVGSDWKQLTVPLVLPNIGDAFQGGYYVGQLDIPAKGRFAMIVSGRANPTAGLELSSKWYAGIPPTQTPSQIDGLANTQAALATGNSNYLAAIAAAAYNVGGYTDWYVPAFYELELAYYYLKPGTDVNDNTPPANPYSVPPRTDGYTDTVPPQTSLALFKYPGGSQYFNFDDPSYITSTRDSTKVWFKDFDDGYPNGTGSEAGFTYCRFMRRIQIA